MHRWLLGYALFVCALGIVSAAVVDEGSSEVAGEGAARSAAASPTPSSTTQPTTTTTEPTLFSPVPVVDQVVAVETPTGLVLPIVGGRPGAREVLTPCANRVVVGGEPVKGAHIVLDPGHGGSEPGAVSPTGQLEKDVNLDVATRVAELLRAEGARVVLTRDRDIRLTLQTRAELARALDPIAFVSIHHNAAPKASGPKPGSELYHQLASDASRRLAGLIWEELQASLSPFLDEWSVGPQPGAQARKSIRTGDDFYGVLRGSQGVPAVLTEAVYLSDPDEDALLATDEFRQAEAEAIARAIIRHVTTEDPGSGYAPTKVSDVPAGSGGGSAGCQDPPLS